MINYGFDPMVGNVEKTTDVWASVCLNSDAVGRNNAAVKLITDPPSQASRMELVVRAGDEDSVDVSPKTFSSGETNLAIKGLTTAKDAVIEARVKGTTTVCAQLNVKVLPLRNCRIALYRVEDQTSPGTSPVGGPSDNEVLDLMDDVFKQACIKFTNVDSGPQPIHVPYDINKDGLTQMDELANHFSYRWLERLNGIFVKASGIPYPAPNPNNLMIRGILADNPSRGFIFTVNIGTFAALGMVHEIGHALDLDHDTANAPTGTTVLMIDGHPLPPTYTVLPNPGKWIRHNDWQTANDAAEDYE